MSGSDMTPSNCLLDQDLTVPRAERKVYLDVMEVLTEKRISFLVGGGRALAFYTGTTRHTKDLDLIVRSKDVSRIMEIFASEGYRTTLRFEHWLGKLSKDEAVVDVIFGSGNGLCSVDEGWFQHAVSGKMFNRPVSFCPPEELIWSKAFLMERTRFDGADIAHLIAAKGHELNWTRLLRRFETHWRVLFSHLILCSYIYPSNRSMIPDWVIAQMLRYTESDMHLPLSSEHICRGTLLSWSQYLADIEQNKYQDGRHFPHGILTKHQTDRLTATFREGE